MDAFLNQIQPYLDQVQVAAIRLFEAARADPTTTAAFAAVFLLLVFLRRRRRRQAQIAEPAAARRASIDNTGRGERTKPQSRNEDPPGSKTAPASCVRASCWAAGSRRLGRAPRTIGSHNPRAAARRQFRDFRRQDRIHR